MTTSFDFLFFCVSRSNFTSFTSSFEFELIEELFTELIFIFFIVNDKANQIYEEIMSKEKFELEMNFFFALKKFSIRFLFELS